MRDAVSGERVSAKLLEKPLLSQVLGRKPQTHDSPATSLKAVQ